MKTASTEILDELTLRGYRITNARIQTVEALVSAKSPLGIQALSRKVSVDEVSVYRTIALLIKERFVEEIRTQGGASRFALSHGHHHHVACTSCDTVVHVPCTQAPAVPSSVEGFSKIISHELTFYGLCKKCA